MSYFKISIEDFEVILEEIDKVTEKDLIRIEEICTIAQKKPASIRLREIAQSSWKKIEQMMRIVILEGKEGFDKATGELNKEIDLLKKDLGENYVWVSEFMSKKITKIWNRVIEMAISSLPKSIKSEEVAYHVYSYSISLKIKTGTDLKISLSELFNFLFQGSLSVKVNYKKI